MFRRHRSNRGTGSRRATADLTHDLAVRLQHAEGARVAAGEVLDFAQQAGRPLSEIRSAYYVIGVVSQEPLPAAPALDRHRPPALTRELSRLRTLRQCYLLDAPPGVLAPAAVRPTSRAAFGPHVAGLDFGVAVPAGSRYERRWGVGLPELLDTVARQPTASDTTSGLPAPGGLGEHASSQ
jgi:hypothetical protein